MMQNLIKRFFAFVFILLLSPKLGLEVYFHELLHQSKYSSESSQKNSSELTVKCHCFDDVSMPLAKSDAIIVDAYIPSVVSVFTQSSFSYISFSKKYSSLRGPPFFTV